MLPSMKEQLKSKEKAERKIIIRVKTIKVKTIDKKR